MTSPNEQDFLHRLAYRLRLIEELEQHERGQHWTLALPGSELAVDDERSRPYRVSHVVGHGLAMSLDAMMGTRLLVQTPSNPNGVRLPMAAPYSMLRTSIEAGALSQWVLAPGESDERVTRSLRAAWDDIVNDDQLGQALSAPREGDTHETISQKQARLRENARLVRGKKRALRAAAEAAGIGAAEFQRELPGFGVLVAEAALTVGIDPNIAQGLWRTLSGLTHPSQSRSIIASSVQLFHTADPDVAHALVTARPDLMAVASEAAFLSHLAALDRTALLGGNSAIRFRPSDELRKSAPSL